MKGDLICLKCCVLSKCINKYFQSTLHITIRVDVFFSQTKFTHVYFLIQLLRYTEKNLFISRKVIKSAIFERFIIKFAILLIIRNISFFERVDHY